MAASRVAGIDVGYYPIIFFRCWFSSMFSQMCAQLNYGPSPPGDLRYFAANLFGGESLPSIERSFWWVQFMPLHV